jgi:hypothetical protein
MEGDAGGGRWAVFPFDEGALDLPCAGVIVFPLGFPLDLDDEEGVLSGIIKV